MVSTLRVAPANVARTFTLVSLLSVAAMAHAGPLADQQRHAHLHKRAQTYKGCYSSSDPLTSAGTYMYQSTGYCGDQCTGKNQAVLGLSGGNECWCGGEIPADSDKVDDSKCSAACTGYGEDDCGGDGFWSVYLTGTDSDVSTYGGSPSPSTSSSKASSTQASLTAASSSTASSIVSTSIAPGHTIVVTIPASAGATSSSSSSSSSISSSSKSGGGSSNTAGIAAGVVVGVVALAGIIGGLVFWMKYKKRKEAEEGYKQRSQVSDFIRGGSERKPPSTGYSHMSDQRLDPEAGARRNSVGSLADNQDYSRRILRVANPDSS